MSTHKQCSQVLKSNLNQITTYKKTEVENQLLC